MSVYSVAVCLLLIFLVPVKKLLLLTYIFDRLPVIFLELYINSSTTCRKEPGW